MCVGTCSSQKRALHPSELDLKVVMSHPTWTLRTELRFPAGTASTLSHRAIVCPGPRIICKGKKNELSVSSVLV